MNITVIGCGRWGSFHAWHANKIGHAVTLYGRKNSATMERLERTGGNDYLTLSKEIRLTRDLADAVNFADVIIISIGSQNLRGLLNEIKICGASLDGKKFLLCMKGLERGTGKRLTTIFNEVINGQTSDELSAFGRDVVTNERVDELSGIFDGDAKNSLDELTPLKDGDFPAAQNFPTVFNEVINQSRDNLQSPSSNSSVKHVAVWVGPGHVEDFVNEIPNCMVIASADEKFSRELAEIFKSPLIRFYYSTDLIGTEFGAATKNVVGIAAGMLDGLNRSCLKGALMARGAAEFSRLISALGGDKMTVYGLSHLGDYEATLFSAHSRNRMFGESFVHKKIFDKPAEGVDTVAALMKLSEATGVELPISRAVYEIIFDGREPSEQLTKLFLRPTKAE